MTGAELNLSHAGTNSGTSAGTGWDKRDRIAPNNKPVPLWNPPACETLRFRNGRVLHRFPPATIPSAPDPAAAALVAEARQHHAVLVADGPTLILVEPKGSTLPHETLAGIRDRAGSIIAVLRGEPFPQGRIIAVYDSGAP